MGANSAGVVPTFFGAAAFALVLMIVVRVVPAFRISIDFTTTVKFESAPITIFPIMLIQGGNLPRGMALYQLPLSSKSIQLAETNALH